MLPAAEVILVAGSLLLWFPKIRDLFDIKVFVDTDMDTRLSRRGTAHCLLYCQCDDWHTPYVG